MATAHGKLEHILISKCHRWASCIIVRLFIRCNWTMPAWAAGPAPIAQPTEPVLSRWRTVERRVLVTTSSDSTALHFDPEFLPFLTLLSILAILVLAFIIFNFPENCPLLSAKKVSPFSLLKNSFSPILSSMTCESDVCGAKSQLSNKGNKQLRPADINLKQPTQTLVIVDRPIRWSGEFSQAVQATKPFKLADSR